MNKKVKDALNKQINKELFSSYLYLGMASFFHSKSLNGMAKWMESQSKEELGHAMKIYSYVFERDGDVVLEKIEKPKQAWKSPLGVFKASLAHEKFITKSIHDLVILARKEKDIATENFLQWFVTEQVEEESSVREIIEKLEMAGTSSHALLMLDAKLGERE